jgi:cyclase
MKAGMRAIGVISVILPMVFFAPNSLRAQGAKPGEAAPQKDETKIAGRVYTFEKIAEGVYYTTSTSLTNTGGNHPIIVGDHDVILVDDGTTPAAARALLEDLKKVTDKPVRWVINTHFHYDHTDGNSIFGPEVQIIGHEYVRHAIADLDVLHREPFKTSFGNTAKQAQALKQQIVDEKIMERRAALMKQMAAIESDLKEFRTLKPTPPNMTYTSQMTLRQGDREVQLLFLGRGHTQGDTVVFLPKERIVCTGDLMESRLAYMGDAMFDEWITTLDALKKLDFDTVLPGHGVPFRGKSLITAFQSYLSDFMIKVAALRKQGLSAEEAAQKVDLTTHRSDFPQIEGPGAEVRGVRRMYEWMDERAH